MREFFERRSISGEIKIGLDSRTWVADKKTIVAKIIDIVLQYQKAGYKLTLRQLYYQLVAADAIPNHDKVYKKIGTILDDCRYSGLLDWNAIEDRGRVPKLPYYVEGVQDAINDVVNQYRLDRQKGQSSHIELWTEKDAISNILYNVTYDYHVRLVINKGYTSSSAMYQAYHRFIEHINNAKPVVILYFGDHDPSGLDMVRDIRDRLLMFFTQGSVMDYDKVREWWTKEEMTLYDLIDNEYIDEKVFNDLMHGDGGGDSDDKFEAAQKMMYIKENELFKVISIGLTMQQITTYKLPPNPAKITDPRAGEYIGKYGQKSWEVDALKPTVLTDLVRSSIIDQMDMDVYDSVLQEEKKDVAKLKKFGKIK